MDIDALDPALDLARRAEFVFVSTPQEKGYPDTRVMFNLLRLRADLLVSGPSEPATPFAAWLGTTTSSQKMQHVRSDPRLRIRYADMASFGGHSPRGTAEDIRNHQVKAELRMDGWESDNSGGLDGGDFTEVRFKPERSRYCHGLSVTEFDASSLGALR